MEEVAESITTRRVYGEIEEIVDEIDLNFERFRNFDQIREAPFDHRFIYEYRGNSSRKRMEQEWDKLQKTLPNSPIFVRIYANRTNLMRAVIIGPPNTPYHHGLFVFDIFFPLNYPQSPPKIHHRSSIPQYLNKNQDGGVPDFDKWLEELWFTKLNSDSISDVLFAIYKSYLGSPPYYHTKGSGGMEMARSLLYSHTISCFMGKSQQYRDIENMQGNILELQEYDKEALLYTCRKMIADISDPPVGFREFVPGYFRKRAHDILWKVKENMDDSYVMFQLFEHLYKVLGANGTYVQHFSGFLEAKRNQVKLMNEQQSDGVISWFKKNIFDF